MRALLSASLSVLLAALPACGNAGKDPAEPAILVTAISNPLLIPEPTPFLLEGSGFVALVGEPVVVTFTAVRGTPFQGGASASITAFVESATELSGTSPASNATSTRRSVMAGAADPAIE